MEESDFVIYTFATYEFAIHHAITIEMYFRFVFQLSHPRATAKEFKFRKVIGSLPNKMHKSIGIMHHIFNIAEYSNVYVIDDLFDGPQAVWSKEIPSDLLIFGLRYHAFMIPAFAVMSRSSDAVWAPSQDRAYQASQVIERSLYSRANDYELKYLNVSRTMQMREQKDWFLFGSLQNIYRVRTFVPMTGIQCFLLNLNYTNLGE